MRRGLLVLAIVLLGGDAAARPLEWGGELRLQLDFGGDEIGTVRYSDGSDSDLKAGTYGTLGLGAFVVPLRIEAHALELSAFAGVGTWSTGPENTDDRLGLTRYPLELLAGYRVDLPGEPAAIRVGGGVQYQHVPNIWGSGALESVDIDVEDALGWVAEVRGTYELFALSLRYTRMEYSVPGATKDLDASSVGVAFALVFPPLAAAEVAEAGAEPESL